ncbi:hypothetical protein JCM6882_002531 [Rhodosporidiobolus microsporus]
MSHLPDTHPDGDPFAKLDEEAAASTLLGRMEARARAEDDAPPSPSLGFAPPKPAAPGKGKPRTSTASANGGGGSGRGVSLGAGREIVIDDSDDTDEDEEEGAQMTGDEGGGSGSDEDEDGSGTDAGSEDGEGTPAEPQPEEDEDDEDDSEDDSEDDDASSKGGEGGEDVQMDEAGKPKSSGKAGADGEASKDGDVAMKDGEAGASGEGEEKKKKKPARKRAQRSPTPPLPAPKPPRPTIRLQIALPPRKGTPGYPEFNILEIARSKGLIPPEEVKKPEEEKDASDAEGKGKEKEGTPGEGGENGAPPKKKRKRGPNVIQGRFGGYDVHDPFVDDSEAMFYEPRFYARPRQEGFFVCSGEVEVAPRRGRVKGSKNKPKFDENGNAIPAPSRRKSTGVEKHVVGKDHKPISGSDAGAAAFGATAPPQEPPKPARKKGEFSPDLQELLDMLKTEADKESWAVKNKFPPHLKELLISVAYHALDINEYDDDFFAVMPKIFPYNLFTMKKLIKREVFPKRVADMTKAQEDHVDVLKQGIADGLPKQRAEFEKKHAEWERQQREGGSGTPGFGAVGVGGTVTPARGATPEASAGPGFGEASPALRTPLIGGGAGDGAEGSPAPGKDDDKGQAEPKWRFRFNDTMRHALYHACDLEDKMSDLITEKQTLEKATTREVNPEKEHSAKNARKALYQKIVNLWPQDMMNTNQLSREISNYKLKLKRTGELPSEV